MGSSETWLSYRGIERVLHLTVLVACGAGLYFLTLRLLGLRLADFRRRAA